MNTRMFRNVLFGVCAIGLALVPAVASAAGLSIAPGSAGLTGKVALTVPVTVSCSASFWDTTTQELFQESISVNVEQASGRSIAHGSSTAYAILPDSLFVQCDGAPVTVPVTVWADVAGPPFHNGSAVVSGAIGLMAGTNCGFPGCYYNLTSISAGFSPQQIKVR